MRILVTGGAGFIGSHLVDAYVKAGHRVSAVDNLDTGFRQFVNPKAKFYKVDVTNLEALGRVFKKARPELVAHLAAFDHIRLSVERPEEAVRGNVLGTLNVLKMMVKYGSRKIIFASTAGPLYGFNPKPLPLEENRPPKCISPYGATKYFAEELIKLWNRLYGIKYTIFRYPNVYGPRQFPKAEAKAIARWALTLLKGKKPELFGDGTKARDYDYIDDVIRAHILATRRGNNELINLGWGKPITDAQVLAAVQKALGTNVKPIRMKPKPGEVYRFYLNVSKAKRILGWKAKISVEDGVQRAIEYYKKVHKTGKITR